MKRPRRRTYPMLLVPPPWQWEFLRAYSDQRRIYYPYHGPQVYSGPAWLAVRNKACAFAYPSLGSPEVPTRSLLAGASIADRWSAPMIIAEEDAFNQHIASIFLQHGIAETSSDEERKALFERMWRDNAVTFDPTFDGNRWIPGSDGATGHIVARIQINGIVTREGDNVRHHTHGFGGFVSTPLHRQERDRLMDRASSYVIERCQELVEYVKPKRRDMYGPLTSLIAWDTHRQAMDRLPCEEHADCRASPELARACTTQRLEADKAPQAAQNEGPVDDG